VQNISKDIPVKILSKYKICVPCEKNAVILLFRFFYEHGFISNQEQMLRMIDRPEFLDSQVISFYNKKNKMCFDIVLENPEKFFKNGEN
ncbi:MAG TPA: hypothetical protein PL060_00750, partial [bacterium]|nr:hypothetical protein [bacterium]